jgi:multicomponent Na+:H+ antiporter subunit G
MREAVIAVLLVGGVGIELLCCVGVLMMRGAYARLHYGAPAGLGAVLLALAILLRQGFSLIGDKAMLIGVFVLLTSPVLSHVTARAAHIRTLDDGSDEDDGQAAESTA